MDHTEHTENTALRGVVGDFISSYAKRDTTVSFSSWLSERLCQELPDLTPEASTKLTAEIMAAVDSYDKAIQSSYNAYIFHVISTRSPSTLMVSISVSTTTNLSLILILSHCCK